MAEHIMQIKLDEAEYAAISDAAQAAGVDIERYMLDALASVANPPVRSGVAGITNPFADVQQARRKADRDDKIGSKLEGQDSSAESDAGTH